MRIRCEERKERGIRDGVHSLPGEKNAGSPREVLNSEVILRRGLGGESWDAEDLLTLAKQWQAGDIGAVGGEGDYRKALEGVKARVLVMPSKTDQYFDWKDGEDEVKYFKNGKFEPIPTVWGHIAGGGANKVDVEWMDKKISEFLDGI